MPDLWVYKRRPNSVTRHKHGGFNASFPMNGHTVVGQIALDELARQVEAARAAEPAAAENRSNVLSFADRRSRASRTPSLRGGKRPGDHTPHRE
ncbi:hypothetical protein [Aestuariispira insulae]|uniref:Uncharacterized protein n=1 Tax=Aestuariispira insulae TaxID=1461337 RepID=A0A3D9H6D4_9PROT|nr:hypothetical protein [Aestuariispira insulae]RED45077.1 hypothetical protein DFP90_11270 [Aestuariispira insulae]